MFVDAEGNVTSTFLKSNLDDITSLEKWIVVSGCNFDKRNKLDEQLVNFSQDNFTMTLSGVINQWVV